MTIKKILGDGEHAWCSWFVGGKITEHSFPLSSLKSVDIESTADVSFREIPDVD